jgi:hypothetical protein
MPDLDPAAERLAAAADAAGDRALELAAAGEYDAALVQARSAVESYQELAAAEPDVFRPDLAAALDGLASRLGEVGRHVEALEAAREAVALFRGLARPEGGDDAVLFVPYLAAALSNLSVRLHESGDDRAAVETAREAVALYRELATPPGQQAAQPVVGGLLPDPADRQQPAVAPPLGEHSAGLAMALGNLANRLDEAHLRSEALAASGEAAAVYQQLAAADPSYLPGLARTINNRAVLLRESGETAVAISTTRQAVNLYRQLATAEPGVYRDYLAMALGNLANMLGDAGRSRDALGVAQQATALYRELAGDAESGAEPGTDNPYHAPLAMSLNNLAVHLAAAGRSDAALAATEEASRLYRALSRRNPQAHLGNLAGTLANLGSDLAAAGKQEEALSATREAVDVTRRLAFGNRPVYLPQLAQAVHQLAVRLEEAGRTSSALANAREAVRLYEELTLKDPDLYADALQLSRDFVAHLSAP